MTRTDQEINEFLIATLVAEVKSRLQDEGKTAAYFDFFSVQVHQLAETHLRVEICHGDIALACDGFGFTWEDLGEDGDTEGALIHF